MPFKILYLDDEPALAQLFVEVFAGDGVEVESFCEPELFVAAVQAQSPDLVFIDFRLPHTTGIEVARRLNRALPKALITGDFEVEVGNVFHRVFQKPYPIDEIFAYIEGFKSKQSRSA